MNMTLYEIDAAILECIDHETGEIIDTDRLNGLELEREKKIENVSLWYKNLCAEAAAYKAEKDSFGEKQKAAEGKAESLKRFLINALDGNPYKSVWVSITYRASKSVDITDMAKIPEEYLKYAEPTADKMSIKKMIEGGATIPGAELVEKQNIQIK